MQPTTFKQPAVVHYFVIKVYESNANRTAIVVLKWTNLRFELRVKYDWYFKYRAALLQVKYPKYIVDVSWGNEPAQGRSLEQIHAARIKSKKAKITEYTNKLNKITSTWNELFPIEEEENYKKAVAKIERLKCELREMEKG